MGDDSVNHIMDNFDFEKVHKYMKATNWTWAGCGVPSVPEIKATARNLLVMARGKGGNHGTGGLTATFANNVLQLDFSIESYFTCVKEG